MPRDPLDAVLRMRRVAVDDARRDLVTSVRLEIAAEQAANAADALIATEGDAAADLAASDGAVEAYARWLPSGRAAARAARTASERASTGVALARAALSAARAAAEAAANLMARRATERAVAAERKSQQDLDEIASRSGNGRTTTG